MNLWFGVFHRRLNEWELAESGDDCAVYTFLHQTLRLQLVFEEHGGKMMVFRRNVTFSSNTSRC